MKFRTEITPLPLENKLTLSSNIFLIGSCFSENIGQKLTENKFETLINPYGVIFNPLSVVQLLEWILEDRTGNYFEGKLEEYYVLYDEVWYNYHLHSRIASQDKDELRNKIKEIAQQTYQFLEISNTIILTFGTAFIYDLLKENEKIPISNCHKQSKNLFEKKLIDLELAKSKLESLIRKLSTFGEKKQIIITVSPVRHLKEGLVENSVSKSILRVLAHFASEKFENVVYFPSYELVLDDLRDYRFYESDLLHPNSQAIEYIWQKFSESCFDSQTQSFLKKWKKISAALAHKPFFPNRESHQKFLQKLVSDLEKIEVEFRIDLQKEKHFLKNNTLRAR
ncbi:GSCFA domain-containing protein [Bernardetia sp.]|uniref:GSCFA domain-containing protein n=1 Tax=Bernardetia sp. TaxID=1937974 RepID=UPI0025BC02D4|nr:GSCFA domain-containing protein [Bernardetia sp.]